MTRIIKYILLGLTFFLCQNTLFAQNDSKIKTAFIYNFTKYIEWPNQNKFTEFSIGILGNNHTALQTELENLSKQKLFNNLPITIKLFNTIDNITPTQMLYINGDDGFDQEKIFNKIKDKGTLLVGENLEDFNKSMINFIQTPDNKQRFSLNQAVIEGENFKINPALLELAITDETEWKNIYSQFEALLKSESGNLSKTVEVSKKDLQEVVLIYEKQRKEIANQKKSIEEQIKQMEEQSAIIEKQKQQVNNLINDINQKNIELSEKQQKIKLQEEKLISLSANNIMLSKNIAKKMEMLSKQKVEIENQKEKIELQLIVLNQQKKEIETQLIVLNQQKKEMQTQQKDIENQKNILQTQLSQIQTQLSKIETQKIMLYMFVGVIFLILSLVFFIYRGYDLKKKANIIITQQKNEVENAKHIIELKNNNITDSLNYAKRIQEAGLPNKKEIYSSLPQCFVLFKPKDIVSGDFYYFLKKEESIFIASADCTGHGVPGAFMSIIGLGKLDEALAQSTDTSKILRYLNKGIKNSLHQSDSDEPTRDGMDIALCEIDINNRIVKYAGANRPLWIIRKGQTVVEEIKATKKAIGGFTEDNQHFDTCEIGLQQGDTFYIATDGYADTFGGQDDKKLSTKRFKEILVSIQDKTMQEQEIYLDNFVENWKAGTEQIDDILVIGIRL